jgi:hypothetical protein
MEDALSRSLGPESKALKRFQALSWPPEKGAGFNEILDEAGEIIVLALVEISIVMPDLVKNRNMMITGKFPPEVEHILNQIQLCIAAGAYDAAAVMIRKAIEAAIYLKFEEQGLKNEMLTETGDTLNFVEKVSRAVKHDFLSHAKGAEIKRIKWLGDSGAHSYKAIVPESEVVQVLTLLGLCLQELYPSASAKSGNEDGKASSPS